MVVGNGMAGTRLVEQIRAHDPRGARVRITVIGDEPHPAYNRILLTNVLAGSIGADQTRMRTGAWGPGDRVAVRTGVRATGIDVARRTLGLDGGHPPVAYDELVLATGSTPKRPHIDGAYRDDGAPGPGVAAFRTLDDCDAIAAAARPGASVTIVGAGLLGIEAARGALMRGASVTLVHPQDYPMDRQLDPDGGAVLARSVRGLGARLVVGRRAAEFRRPGANTGAELVLDDGSRIATDLLILAAGTGPRTDLARTAGIDVADGIIVDDAMRTSAPHVSAAGDCCEHRGVVYGLVQPAWEQTSVLAGRLCGAGGARYSGSAQVTRLKAHDIDLVAMGRVDVSGHDELHEVLTLADPARGRYAKAVVRAGRLVGALSLGNPGVAGAFTQLFDSRGPVPSDRMSLLVGRAPAGGAALPEDAGPGAVVCRCNSVTRGRIAEAWRGGATTSEAIARSTRAGTGCGGCRDAVAGLCGLWNTRGRTGPADEGAPDRRNGNATEGDAA
ncbi:FAD-dependent oxidoreductase [Tomitella fengzijianii]|uniref:FAD-dependent oxidoreductase n=1 Tax=Tomitella fengzijianii TaxID=2597660 RepID=UPI001F379DB1|nr:FAD-dependent oxidoreductase [Tomitella fengzijianii]